MRLLVGILVGRRRGRDACSSLLDPPLAFLPPSPLVCTALRMPLRSGLCSGLCNSLRKRAFRTCTVTFRTCACTFRAFREVLVKSLLQV